MIVDNLEKFASDVLNEKTETDDVVFPENIEEIRLGGDIEVPEVLGGIPYYPEEDDNDDNDDDVEKC